MEETKELTKQELSPEDIKTLVEVGIIPKDCSAELIKLYGKICSETQLNPFRKQIHFIRRGNAYTVQIGIDGYRSIADRTGLYAGSDDYVFDDEKNPNKATVTVYKLVGGIRCPFTASARMDEYKPKDVTMQFMWNKMPHLMLGKVAESLVLRKAFPNELSGTYTDEEMQQADIPQPKEINVHIQKQVNGGSPVADKAGPPPSGPVSTIKSLRAIERALKEEVYCEDCSKQGRETLIKSQKVIEHSLKEYGMPVCWDCQGERKGYPKKDKEGKYTDSYPELHEESSEELAK